MSLDRRAFLAAGGLVVAFAITPRAGGQGDARNAQRGTQTVPPTPLPGSLKTQPMLDGWIRVAPDGTITVFTGKAELGQGIKTALVQVAAEELAVDPYRVAIVTADTERTANEGYTAGSHSMQDSGTAIRNAAAQVRAILVGMAAARLGVAAEQLRVEQGKVIAPNGPHITYGELVAADAQPLHAAASPQSALRPPDAHRVVGTSMKRIDIPAKVSGGAAYVQDLRFDGMVHGRIVRPPAAKATLVSLDDSGVRKLAGVLQLVRDGRFLGVIAAREYQAVVAQRALAQATRWEVPAQLPNPGALYRSVRSARSEDSVILDRAAAALPSAATTVAATYQRPYQMHASIGPSCAVARLADGRMTVWTHSQGVYPLRSAIAELLAMQPNAVRCIHVEGSGCYGHNGADDVAGDAALLARALPGRAVRVQWMREDEHGHEPYGPPMIVDLRAALDASGAIVSWQHDVWSNPHSTRPGAAGDLLAGTELATPFAPTPSKPLPQPEGGGDRNAIPLYALPSARVVHHFLPDMPLRVSALRSLGAYMNVYAIESFVDELARAARADPVAFRLRHLADPRAKDVIHTAAERFGWSAWQVRAGHGRGMAFARYKNLAAYCAVALELQVDPESGGVRIVRAVAAVDSGEAVNPDGIANQIEGGIVQSASWTLAEQVRFDTRQPTSLDWGGYPILRFPQVPGRIEVFVLDRRGQPFLGTGEAAQGPAAAAIANAFADATGRRVRDLPLDPPRVRAAFAA
ncbi:MAG: xanthine dehydrogenase family protein molybdopterin-binding subunit [Rhizobacter sp.]|nr:xanthine dehydrogenase family protein molybdopterin-binding subunit [Rhizobacter sp.]